MLSAIHPITRSVLLSVSALLLSAQAVLAAPSQCPNNYHEGQRPNLINKKLGASATELCSDYYAVWYSGVARSPVWAAEYLTKGRIDAGRNVPRSNDFRPDTRLPSAWRSDLRDYRGSGFDRGHLAPSADMPTPGSDSQSFLLSNMIPQDPTLNRSLWSAIEAAVRAQARYSPVYVITGPLFQGKTIKRLNNRVLIPTHVYKLVYDPKRNMAAAYLVENAPRARHREVSLQELEALAGIDFLPGATRVQKLKLPRPRY